MRAAKAYGGIPYAAKAHPLSTQTFQFSSWVVWSAGFFVLGHPCWARWHTCFRCINLGVFGDGAVRSSVCELLNLRQGEMPS